jgi:hypothetical protein
MKNMSFALTTSQFLDGSKTVTRRLGWEKLKVGDQVMACEKCMGLGLGGKIVRLGAIRITSVRREPLNKMTKAECAREGFPNLTPNEFVAMFCEHMGCRPETKVTRIEFEKVAR